MKKRIGSLLLALALCLTLLPATAFAADSDFVIKDGVLTAYNGPGGDVVIPDGVTKIGAGAFCECDSLTSVTIPNSVTSIQGATFSRCTGLTSVTIPNGVTSIGENAFYGCIGLTSVTISDGVTSIGEDAFHGCTSLANVTIPSSVTWVGESAFYDTPWLKSLGDFAIVNGFLMKYQGSGSDVVIPDSVTNIGDGAFSFCDSLTSVTIPDGVTGIGENAFERCTNLTSVTIPNSVTSIGEAAFLNCGSLTSVTIPDGVTSIGKETFYGCEGLTSVTIPASVTNIEKNAFHHCASLTDVYYGGSEAQWSTLGFQVTKRLTLWEDKDITDNVTVHCNTVGGFGDVKTGAYYADAVLWAVDKGVTNGTGVATFSPDQTCTHAHILTFLWRAAGKPSSGAALPVDITGKNVDWAADALRWAAEKGMVGAGFDPNAPCNRADAVNYIWQAFGKGAASYNGQFTDVPANSPYATAVAWALANGVTTGTSATTFTPAQICTRGQIVTFLYRAYAN